MDEWLDTLLKLSHLVLALLNNHLKAMCRHIRRLQQMLILINIHRFSNTSTVTECQNEIADQPDSVWMPMKTKDGGSVWSLPAKQNMTKLSI